MPTAAELLARIAARKLANPAAFALELAEKEAPTEAEDAISYLAKEEDLAWNKELLLAFYKWWLLHPMALNNVTFDTLTKLSGSPVLATFERNDTVRLLPLFNITSNTMLYRIVSLLDYMQLCLPASLHQELYDYLAANKQASQDREGGG
jgi:hypothetical protein